ncbi:MAG: tetratricopeptide repeat protein [Planctomycetes bacterium]|nr:tetratricopeptide repeat protein [Planctomycetota bacterium]
MRLFSLLLLGLPALADSTMIEQIERLLSVSQEALLKNEFEKSAEAAKRALALGDKELTFGKTPRAYLAHGRAYELLGRHKEAVADFTRAIELDPKAAEAFNLRGSEQFKLGHLAESLADFDRFLKLRPDAVPGHWKRGITLYYLGKYDEGRKQFEGYEKVDTNDVENAVWHFLCVARKDGVKKARVSLLKIGKDQRVPMMEVYALFAGKAKREDVLKAAEADRPTAAQKNARLFYAHLYLGLYHEVHGNAERARKHLSEATDNHRVGHYMWDVARVHRDLLRKRE